MIEKVSGLDGHTFYKDAERRYSRIIGAIAWPGAKPGFIVAVGEDYFASDAQGNVRHLRILGEVEEVEPERSFKKCVDFRERYQIERFLADTENESMLNLLYHFNKGLDGAHALVLHGASFPSDFPYHVSLIKSCVRPQNKTLHFGESSLLRDYLLEINVDDASGGKAGEYPAITAVGFVLSYIRNHPKDPVRDRIRQISREEPYNPLTFGLGPAE